MESQKTINHIVVKHVIHVIVAHTHPYFFFGAVSPGVALLLVGGGVCFVLAGRDVFLMLVPERFIVCISIIIAQWEGMGDVGSARYEPALLPPMPDHKGFKLQ